MNWSIWLAESRAESSLSIHALSSLSGLASAQIHAIEQGQSKITLNAIVKLCFGMGISLRELLQTAGITHTILSTTTYHNGQSHHLTATDIQEFLSTHKKLGGYAQLTKHFLYESFYRIIQLAPMKYQLLKDQSTAYNAVGDTLKVASDAAYQPLVYPRFQPPRYYTGLTGRNAAIMIRDFGAYIKALRTQNEMSLMDLAALLEISHSALSRLEQGKVLGKVKFDLVLKLDKFFEQIGAVICAGWSAEEFQTGIIQNRLADSPPPPILWDPREFAVAETLITISRWYARYDLEKKWVNALRVFISQIENGQITPPTGSLSDLTTHQMPALPGDAILDTVFQ